MTPLEIFTLGKGLWSLYEKVDEHFENKQPEQNNNQANGIFLNFKKDKLIRV